MAAPIQNIEINQGATFTMQITLKNKTTLLPIDIALYEFCGAIKQTIYDDANFPFRFVIIDAVNGIVHAILDPEVSKNIDFNEGLFDISYKLSDGSITRIIMGAVTVSLGGTDQC